VNFFTPKLMKIRWSSLFLGSFASHFQITLSIHASNFNSRFASLSELELFLLMEVLIPNFNTMDLVKILEKNQKLHIQILLVTLKQGCHKRRFWRKITVRTSFSSGRPRASAFTLRTRFYPWTGFYRPPMR
jgi:hypothetical protein